ncbi:MULTISPECIES: RDD family protein [unclassified Actinomadura]|uniref:RDD family protein n=1 Tax=unclassified Actinomadura TaxID=2626254 RepID=UPI0011EE4F59|nr:RDD family protein [Actinomadura sp. K4S16]
MSEPPQDTPKPDSGWQPPDRPREEAQEEAPVSPERPPPYQGSYGGPPAQAAPMAGYGHPGALPQAPPVPGYGPPGVPHPGFGGGTQDAVAGRAARLGAGIIDSVVLSIGTVPAVLFSIRWDRMRDSIESGEPVTNPLDLYNIPRLLVGYGIVVLLGFVYFTVLHARWGQTLGKKAFGIRLVRADDRSAVSWGQALGRQAIVYGIGVATGALNLLLAGGAILGLLGLLDNAWILWDDRRQALHDKAVKTIVVKVTPWTPNPYARDRSGS